MEIDDGTWTLFGGLAAACSVAAGWLYARIGAVHGRIDRVTNHMTQEDNKLHARVDTVREQYVRRDDLDARLLRLEAGQDKLLEKFEEFANSSRHNLKNVEQVVTRLDERVKHIEDRK